MTHLPFVAELQISFMLGSASLLYLLNIGANLLRAAEPGKIMLAELANVNVRQTK